MRNFKKALTKVLCFCFLALCLTVVLLPSKAEAKSGKPAKVVDVHVELTKNNSFSLSFKVVEGAYKYQYVVTDGKYEYAEATTGSAPNVKAVYKELRTVNNSAVYSCTISNSLRAVDGKGFVKDSKGNSIYSNNPNTTYYLKVRAVNYDGTSEYYGDWSDPVTFKGTDWKGVITNFRYAGYEDGVYLFSYTGDVSATTGISLYAFKDANYGNSSFISSYMDNFGRLCVTEANVQKYIGATVYIAAVYNNSHNATDSNGSYIYSNAIPFTPVDHTVKSNPKISMSLANSGLNYIEARFSQIDNKKALANDSYKITKVEYSTSPDFSSSSTFSSSSGRFYSSINNFNYGVTYYVRATFENIYRESVRNADKPTLNNMLSSDSSKGYKVSSIYNDAALGLYYYYRTTQSLVYSNVVTFTLRDPYKVSLTPVVSENKSYVEFMLPCTLYKKERIRYVVSNTPNFSAYPENELFNTFTSYGSNDPIYLEKSLLTPKTKYYVHARMETNTNPDDNEMEEYVFGPWSAAVSFTVDFTPHILTADINKGKGILLMTSGLNNEDKYEGMELQKKSGKKYKTIYKGSMSSYNDTSVKANETYIYRSRLYIYNEATKKYIYSDWREITVVNWKGDLCMSAVPKSKNSVSVSWSKLNGATGYEIYRTSPFTISSSNVKSSSARNDYQLIKTLPASKSSFTDTKLATKSTYGYQVRAYKTVGGKKTYISACDTVSLDFFDPVTITKLSTDNKGKTSIVWKKVIGAKKYVIEKYDHNIGNWVTYKTTSKTKLSLSANSPSYLSSADTLKASYRIKAINGSKVSVSDKIDIGGFLSAPKKMSASVLSNGSVKLTWSKVNGASYYEIFRNKELISVCIPDSSCKLGYKITDKPEVLTAYDMHIEVVDANGYSNVLSEGFEGGLCTYYVKACKKFNNISSAYVNDDLGPIYSEATQSSTVKVPSFKLAIPTISKVSSKSGKVTVKWSKVSGASGYEILRSTKKSSGYSVVATIKKGSTTSYTDKKVSKKKTYYYKIRSLGTTSLGDSASSILSEYKSVKVK